METTLGAERSRPVLRKALMYRPDKRPLVPANPLIPSNATDQKSHRSSAVADSSRSCFAGQATAGHPSPVANPASRLNGHATTGFSRDTYENAPGPINGELMTIARAAHRHLFNQHPEHHENRDLVDDEKSRFLPLSRTTDRVLNILLTGDLYRLRAESVAEALGISCTTLRRRLRNDHTSYQFLLDRARQFRCEAQLKARWLPGKCLADELGYLEVNSFYRAFRRWTGLSYSEYRVRYD
ncbi:MAG: AraC family transcriptional regulator [Pseudomonadota bacterium]